MFVVLCNQKPHLGLKVLFTLNNLGVSQNLKSKTRQCPMPPPLFSHPLTEFPLQTGVLLLEGVGGGGRLLDSKVHLGIANS